VAVTKVEYSAKVESGERGIKERGGGAESMFDIFYAL
jgi:hypothetical protein